MIPVVSSVISMAVMMMSSCDVVYPYYLEEKIVVVAVVPPPCIDLTLVQVSRQSLSSSFVPPAVDVLPYIRSHHRPPLLLHHRHPKPRVANFLLKHGSAMLMLMLMLDDSTENVENKPKPTPS